MSSAFQNTRRRQIRAKGSTVTLRRQTAVNPQTWLTADVLGLFTRYRPEQVSGDRDRGVQQGDAMLSILGDFDGWWIGPPKKGDTVLVQGAVWAVVGVFPVLAADQLLGFDLWIRGGA